MADTSSVYSRPSRRAGEEPVEGPKKPAPVEVQSTTYTRVTRTVEPREALRPVARRLPALNYRNVALGIGLLSIIAYMLLRSTTLPAAPVVHKPTIKDKATEGYEKLQETLGAAKERAAEGMDYAKGHMDDLQYRLGLKKKPETRLEYVWHMIRDSAYAPFGWAQQRVWNMYDWVTHFGRPTKAKLHVESTLDEAKLKAERAKNLAKEKLMEGGDLAKEKLHDAGRSAESLGERLKDSAKETVGELKDRVYEMPGRVAEGTDRLKEKAYEYAHGAKETVHEAKLSAESLAEKAAHRAEEKLHDAERTGATVAERAGDYLKETYTAVKDSVLEAGAKLQQTADSIKETVIETKDSAKEKLHDAVRAKDSAAEKAADYAREKYEALKDRAAEGVLAGKEKLHEARETVHGASGHLRESAAAPLHKIESTAEALNEKLKSELKETWGKEHLKASDLAHEGWRMGDEKLKAAREGVRGGLDTARSYVAGIKDKVADTLHRVPSVEWPHLHLPRFNLSHGAGIPNVLPEASEERLAGELSPAEARLPVKDMVDNTAHVIEVPEKTIHAARHGGNSQLLKDETSALLTKDEAKMPVKELLDNSLNVIEVLSAPKPADELDANIPITPEEAVMPIKEELDSSMHVTERLDSAEAEPAAGEQLNLSTEEARMPVLEQLDDSGNVVELLEPLEDEESGQQPGPRRQGLAKRIVRGIRDTVHSGIEKVLDTKHTIDQNLRDTMDIEETFRIVDDVKKKPAEEPQPGSNLPGNPGAPSGQQAPAAAAPMVADTESDLGFAKHVTDSARKAGYISEENPSVFQVWRGAFSRLYSLLSGSKKEEPANDKSADKSAPLMAPGAMPVL